MPLPLSGLVDNCWNCYWIHNCQSRQSILWIPSNLKTVTASFDIESLVTDVPPLGTIQFITNLQSDESLSQFRSDKKQFVSLLNIATKDSAFTFDKRLLLTRQSDLIMLFFLCHHGNNCPQDFNSNFSYNYTDYSFLIFKQHSYEVQFLLYLN